MADPITDSQAAPADATSTTASPADASQSQAATPEASTTPATSAEAKPADAAKPEDKPVEAAKEVVYEFKLPEGVEFKGELLDELKTTAKELGLTQEQAQRVADLGAKQAQGFAAQLIEQQKTMTAEWAEQTTTDKEIGGDKLPENLGVAKKALDSFGTPALKTLLNQSGLGNHPEVVRFMVKAGKAISEDGHLVTGAAAQADRANTPIENRLYPNQK
jgi:hypothetical protein